MISQRIECLPVHAGRYNGWTSKFFRVRDDIDGMKALYVDAGFLGFGYQVDRSSTLVDYRRASDSDLRHEITAGNFAVRNGRNILWINKALLPEHSSVVSI